MAESKDWLDSLLLHIMKESGGLLDPGGLERDVHVLEAAEKGQMAEPVESLLAAEPVQIGVRDFGSIFHGQLSERNVLLLQHLQQEKPRLDQTVAVLHVPQVRRTQRHVREHPVAILHHLVQRSSDY